MSNLLIDNKELMKEYNAVKNNNIDINSITLGSNKKVWWICSKGHEWEAKISDRNNGTGCPYCNNKKILPGYNDLATTNPQLVKEWNYVKNKNLKPVEVTKGSKRKVWWICSKGHEWQEEVVNRTLGRKCPFCTGKKRIVGQNDIFSLHPNWSKYWNYELNNADPYSYGAKSHKIVNWICSKCGRNFSRKIVKMKDIVLCPECANIVGKKTKYRNQLLKTGSLINIFPKIAKEWNYEKNNGLRPDDFLPNSNKKVWWKCSNGHEWEATINSRSNNGNGCPICANQKVLKGYNDLATIFPEFLSEWNYKKNKVSPSEIIARTGKKYWWICKFGHEYETSPLDRFYGRGCPICNGERGTSIGEKTVFYYIQQYYKDEIVSNYRSKLINNKEIDIFLPKLAIGVEYDGIYFHKNKKRDEIKDKICLENGIKIIHIAESKSEDKIKNNYIYYNVNKFNNLEWAIRKLLSILFGENDYDINISRDRMKIYNLIDYYEKEKSLLNNYPEIAKEWNYEKNGKLKPEFVSYGSSKKVWWKCVRGHEYESIIYSRIKGSSCPYCSGQKVLKGFNDLESLSPEIAKEWNYDKNGDLKPFEISNGSNKKVWWKCSKGHEWTSQVYARTKNNHGCPKCTHQKTIKGTNDLKTVNPKLVKEWNYKKNESLNPSDFFPNSKKRVWWIGNCGHEWKASICSRNNGNGCPYCANQKILVGYNDLATKRPDLIKEWDFEKNGKLKPEQCFPSTHKKVWWKCSKGHSYETYISNRIRNSSCPICSNKKIITGLNDLATINPELLKEWDYEKNTIKPTEISCGSGKKAWWKCPNCGNSWESKIIERTKGFNKCLKCYERKRGKNKKRIVIQLDLDGNKVKNYDGIVAAANEYNISSSAIHNCLSGKTKTAGGYIWKYADEEK